MTVRHYTARNFKSATSIGYLVKMAHMLMHDHATAAFAGHDVTFQQWLVLLRLKEGRELTASDLCRTLRHDTGALTRLLDQLEERGYISRQRSRDDRRVVHLQLTEAGAGKCSELTPIIVDKLNAALADFSKEEFNELSRLLNKLIDTIRKTPIEGAD